MILDNKYKNKNSFLLINREREINEKLESNEPINKKINIKILKKLGQTLILTETVNILNDALNLKGIYEIY